MSTTFAPSVRDVRHLRGIRRGDIESLEAIYLMYHKRVFSFLYRLCWNPQEAAALTEDTFEVLWKAALVVDAKLPLDLTLYRIARNVFIDEERDRDSAVSVGVSGVHASVEPAVASEGAVSTKETRASARHRSVGTESVSDAAPDGESHRVLRGTLSRRQEQALADALFSLEPDAQAMFVLLVYQGLTIDQVAVVLGVAREHVMEIACQTEANLRATLGPMIRAAGGPDGSGLLDDDKKQRGRSRRQKKSDS